MALILKHELQGYVTFMSGLLLCGIITVVMVYYTVPLLNITIRLLSYICDRDCENRACGHKLHPGHVACHISVMG